MASGGTREASTAANPAVSGTDAISPIEPYMSFASAGAERSGRQACSFNDS
jgi:hypothetical protein